MLEKYVYKPTPSFKHFGKLWGLQGELYKVSGMSFKSDIQKFS